VAFEPFRVFSPNESFPPSAKSFHRTLSGFRIDFVVGPVSLSPFDISCFLSIEKGASMIVVRPRVIRFGVFQANLRLFG